MTSNYQQERGFSQDYESRSSQYATNPTSTTTYRSSVAPRSNSVNRTRGSRANAALLPSRAPTYGVPLRTTVSSSVLASSGSGQVIGAINNARRRDKRDLVELNDKFAQYVEKIRFLDAQNRKLHKELEALESRNVPRSSVIKEMYDIEMTEARKLLDQTQREAEAAQELSRTNADALRRLQAQYDGHVGTRQTDQREVANLQQRIADNDAQIALLRRRLEDIEDEIRLYKDETQRVSSDIARLQNDIEQEGLLRNAAVQDKIRAEDELATLKQQQNDRLKDVRSQNISSDLDPTRFFRNELATAIRDIRQKYEDEIKDHQDRLQFQYTLLVNRFPQLNSTRVGSEAVVDSSSDRRKRQLHEQWIVERDYYRKSLAEQELLTSQINNLKQDLQSLNAQAASTDQSYDDDFACLRERRARVEQEYAEVSTLRTSLQQELLRYRQLLEGQDGLQGCVNRIEQQSRVAITGGYNELSNSSSTYTNTASAGYVSRTYINRGASGVVPTIPSTTPLTTSYTKQSSSGGSAYQHLADSPRRRQTPDSPPISRSHSRDSNPDNYAQRENILRSGTSSASSTNRNSRVYESAVTTRTSLIRGDSSNRYEDPADSNYDAYGNN